MSTAVSAHFSIVYTGLKGKSNWKVVDELAAALRFTPLQLENASKTSSHWSASAIPVRSKKSKSLGRSEPEEVAEHESLVTLMALIDASFSRKKMILGAIEEVHTIMVQHLPFGEDPSIVQKTSEKVDQHYTWLLANLEATNQVLETALGHLRTLYGKAYLVQRSVSVPGYACRTDLLACVMPSGRELTSLFHHRSSEALTTKHQFIANAVGDIFSGRFSLLPPMTKAWLTRVLTDAEDVGKAIAASLRPATESSARDSRSLYLKERLASIGALALTSSCCQQLLPKTPATDDSTTTGTAQAVAARKLSRPHLPAAPDQGLYAEMVAARNLAIEDLDEAVDLLNAELAASTLQQSL